LEGSLGEERGKILEKFGRYQEKEAIGMGEET
jgi:hypothetical protein